MGFQAVSPGNFLASVRVTELSPKEKATVRKPPLRGVQVALLPLSCSQKTGTTSTVIEAALLEDVHVYSMCGRGRKWQGRGWRGEAARRESERRPRVKT